MKRTHFSIDPVGWLKVDYDDDCLLQRISLDGQWVAVGLEYDHTPPIFRGAGQFWDLENGALVAQMPYSGQALKVVFSHHGRSGLNPSCFGYHRLFR